MQEITKQKNRHLLVFPFLFCRFPNMVILEEFLAIDQVLDEVDQVLDETAAYYCPHPWPATDYLLPISTVSPSTTKPCTGPSPKLVI